MRNEGRDINLEQVTPHVVHPGLHQDYDLDFRMRRVDDIAPTLTSPLLSGLVSNIHLLGRPEVPREPASSKMEEGLWGHSGAPARPDAPGPSCISGPAPHMLTAEVETKENKLREQGGIDLDQTLPGPNPEDAAAVVISDDDETDLPIDMPQAASTPKVEPAWNQKQPLEERSPCSSPPKKWATEEKEGSTPPHEAVLPRGVTEEDILPKRYETFTLDNDWVQCVKCSLLGLEAGTTPSRRDIDTLGCFVPRVVASESDLPEVITDHWLPILSHEFRVGTDKEFLLLNFHRHECLVRQLFNLAGRCRQLAFCPYCGVINGNSDTALSHVRKHLDLQFICGGCYSKSFLNGPALNKHMKAQCPSVTAI